MKETFTAKNLKLHFVLTILIGLSLLFHNVYVESIYIVAKIVAFGSMVVYYDLTNRFTTALAIISFILNIVLLQIEIIIFTILIQDAQMYETGEHLLYVVLITVLVLWATNKLCIDSLYFKIGKIPKQKMRIEFIIENYRLTKEFKYKDTSNNP